MRKVVYPGSFDPITLGHLDIIKRAASLFDELIISVLNNKEKMPLFSVEERVKILKKVTADLPNVKVDSFSGLLVEYAKENDISVAVRGLRTTNDFEYELQIAQTNDMLSGGKLETIFLTANPEYSFISSSAVREIASFGGNVSSCVPDDVLPLIYEKYKSAYPNKK